MNKRNYFGTLVLLTALLLASGIPASAKNSRSVTLSHDAVLSGTSLPAGIYVIRWEAHNPEATVEFVQNNKVVLSTVGRIEERNGKNNRNAVIYDTASNGNVSLTEIRLGGSREALVFNQ